MPEWDLVWDMGESMTGYIPSVSSRHHVAPLTPAQLDLIDYILHEEARRKGIHPSRRVRDSRQTELPLFTRDQ